MKYIKICSLIFYVLLTASCVSLQDRTMTTTADFQLQVLGNVYATFTTFQPLHIPFSSSIKKTAYKKLLEEAKKNYAYQYNADDLDIRNIDIKGSEPFSVWPNIWNYAVWTTILGNFQDLSASGTVVIKKRESEKVNTQERVTIAVFPFEDIDNLFTQNESVLFYRRFSNEFSNRNNDRFIVTPRQDVEKLFNTEAKFQLSDFSAKTKTAEMERVLNGSQILSGYIGKIGNKVTVSVSLFTYPDMVQLPGGVDMDVADKDELFAKIPELVRQMQNRIAGGAQR